MAKVNKTKYAILGLLSMKPASGYDLKKTVDGNIGFFWNENFGHIYPILKRLEKDGLIKRSTRESGSYPAKYVYSLTTAGKREFLDWLREAPEETPVRNEMLLKLFFGRQTDRKQVESMIMAERRKNEELLKAYGLIAKRIAVMKSDDYGYWNFTLQFGVRKSEMIISWCDETLGSLKKLK
jgi:PadR family transcriptional regulator, regulatory protein AphA